MFGIRRLLIPSATLLALPFARPRGEEKNVRAVYLFHRSGAPLVAAASDAVLRFEPKHREPHPVAVRDFCYVLDTTGQGSKATIRPFDEEAVLGVRGHLF